MVVPPCTCFSAGLAGAFPFLRATTTVFPRDLHTAIGNRSLRARFHKGFRLVPLIFIGETAGILFSH